MMCPPEPDPLHDGALDLVQSAPGALVAAHRQVAPRAPLPPRLGRRPRPEALGALRRRLGVGAHERGVLLQDHFQSLENEVARIFMTTN